MTAASVRSTLAFGASIPCAVALAPVYVVALALAGFAQGVRWLARRCEPAFTGWTALIEYHPTLGWKPKPGLDAYYLADGDDVFRVVTDDEGWPGRQSLEESEVVVIGDSFAFGYGADSNASFAARMRSATVKAVGAPGYSMVQGVRLMEELGDRLRGKLVVWFLFLENDLQDNLSPEMRGYRAPFARHRDGSWQIADAHLRPERWRCSSQDSRRLLARFCVAGPLSERAMSASDFLIARASAACDRAGATLAVVTIPHPQQLTAAGLAALAASSGSPAQFDAQLPERRIAESCGRRRIVCEHASAYLRRRDYKHREGIHWNRRGHRKVASLLETMYGSYRARSQPGRTPRASDPSPRIAQASPHRALGR